MSDPLPPSVRVSDVEREAVIARMREAAAEGRLTFEELADRTGLAATAVTRADLERLTTDLPDAVSSRSTGLAVTAPARVSTPFGDIRRSGTWIVPSQGSWKSVFGDIVLDLREAQVADSEVHIEAKTVCGDIELLVPEGVLVDVYTRTLFGDVKQEASSAQPGAPRIVLTGGTTFGDVKIRSRRLREKLADHWVQMRRRSGTA